MKKIFYTFIGLFILLFFMSCIIGFISYSNKSFYSTTPNNFSLISSFSWPIPGYNSISSNFGFRISPTNGASKYHSGIDIPAPEGTNLYSVTSGKIAFVGFYGANGYTIMIENNNMLFIYGHVSPNFIVNVDNFVSANQLIGHVGPKYVSATPNNPFKDSSRKIYKRSNYWLSFAFWRKNRWHSHRSCQII